MILNKVEGLKLLVNANISDLLLFSVCLKDLGLVILFNFCDLDVFPQKAFWEFPRGVHCVWECIHPKKGQKEKITWVSIYALSSCIFYKATVNALDTARKIKFCSQGHIHITIF